MGQYFATEEFNFEKFNMHPHRVEKYLKSVQYEEAGVLEKYSFHYLYKLMSPYFTPDEALQVSRLFTELDTFLQESITSFIINGVTDDSWNTFMATAKAIGSEEYAALYQNAFDAYCAANGL
jgi:putative aldouronate transport system substrate-binding protein